MRLILEASPEEFATLIKELSEGKDLSQRTIELFSILKSSSIGFKPLPVGDIWDDFTWAAIHLFDIIRVHHTEKTEDFFSIPMDVLVKNHYAKFGMKSLQISRIIGGARQVTNKYSRPPCLQIHKTSNEKFHSVNL